jgi:hypothetical protein
LNISPLPVATSSTRIPFRIPEFFNAREWALEWKKKVLAG